MILLQDIDPKIGGLEIIPNTANDKFIDENFGNTNFGEGDFHPLGKFENIKGKGKLVTGKAGDLILWDSRTIHGGVVGPGYEKENSPLGIDKFGRLAFTICMTPKKLAS